MKFPTLFLTLSFAAGSVFADAPSVPVEKAIALAQEQLHVRGLEKTIFIQSAVLESASLLGGTRVWKVCWSDTVPASSGRVELGLEINMKGEVVRLVKRVGETPRH